MDMQMHYLGNSARRVPMNQDEFDTKFNFSKENRLRHLSVDEGSGGGSNGVTNLAQLCGACCRDNAMSAYNLEAMARHSATTRLSSVERRAQPPRMVSARASLKRGSFGVVRGASTVTVPLCYELNYDGGRALVFDDDASTNEGTWRSKFWFISYFPLIDCLQRYSFRKDFVPDLRAGVILGLHSAAEGFIFSYLAGVPPMVGLYTAFCATFIYMFFGTSPYSIMGSNILVCFLVRNIIERVGLNQNALQNSGNTASYDESAFQIVSTLTFLVAFFHFSIYVFRLHFVFSYLSEYLLAGLSVGVAVRILLGQLSQVLSIRDQLCNAIVADTGTASDIFATFGAQNHTPSYLYCVFWSTYRRIFGAALRGGGALNETALQLSEGKKSLSTLTYPSGKCVATLWDCLESLNVETLVLSLFALFFLVFCRQVFDPLMRLRLRYSISFELILIVIASILSQFFLDERFEVLTLKYVGEQFRFHFPRLSLFGELGADGLALALLSFAIHTRNSPRIHVRQRQNASSNENNNDKNKTEQRNSYHNRRNKSCDVSDAGASDCIAWWNERQELFAFVMIGIMSMLVGAYPSTVSAGRTRIATESGTRSTVVNVSLALTMLPLIVWWPIFLRGLPICVLSCIVIMRAVPLFFEIVNFARLWNVSRIDLATFLFTVMASLLVPNLSHALFAGIIFATSTIVIRLQWPTFHLLVNVTGSGAYYAEKAFYGAELDESGVAVMRYEAPILFNNVSHFYASVLCVADTIKGQLLGIGIGTRAGSMKSMKSINTAVLGGGNGSSSNVNTASIAAASCRDFFATNRSTLLISGDVVPNYDVLASSADQPQMSRVLILDFSAVSAVDICGIDALKSLYVELASRKTRLLFASVNSVIRVQFKSAGGFDVIAKSMFFPSVHDAVLYAQQLGGVIAPSIHMSVSMNGCRDLITLSATTSHLDMSGGNNAQHNQPPAFLPCTSGNVTASQPNAAGGDNVILERQSAGGSIANLTIGSNNSQPTASISAHTAPAAGFNLDGASPASSAVPSPTPSQQQPLATGPNKLRARHSNA